MNRDQYFWRLTPSVTPCAARGGGCRLNNVRHGTRHHIKVCLLTLSAEMQPRNVFVVPGESRTQAPRLLHQRTGGTQGDGPSTAAALTLRKDRSAAILSTTLRDHCETLSCKVQDHHSTEHEERLVLAQQPTCPIYPTPPLTLFVRGEGQHMDETSPTLPQNPLTPIPPTRARQDAP